MYRASPVLLLLLGCDQAGSPAHEKVISEPDSTGAVVDAAIDADPCPESVAAFCDSGLPCVMDWAQAADPAQWCKGLRGGGVNYPNGVCAGTRAVFLTGGVDSFSIYEYDAVTGKLVAITAWLNADDRCWASDLSRGNTPVYSFAYGAPPGPRCFWTDDGGFTDWECEADGAVSSLDAGQSDAIGE